MSLSGNKIIGFEVLVRLSQSDGQLLYPDRFISVAEEHGLIGKLTEQVLELSCRDISQDREFFAGKHVSVNICAQNIEDLAFPELLEHITSKYSVDACQLCLELTETEVMRELTSSLDVLNRLRMKGFSLSIDDFGTGFSSLSQLYNAPFSELKIDQHFIMRMLDDNEARVIVEICIMLGKMLGMSVIAEGVENDQIT
jgi:EAL domain-containing protein (putative c-di-GMP-specific phosphodiesterase class I)